MGSLWQKKACQCGHRIAKNRCQKGILKGMQTGGSEKEKPVKFKLDLSRLSDAELEKMAAASADQLSEAQERDWDVACEQMVREVRVSWPSARYLALWINAGGQYGERWEVLAVYDAAGEALSDVEAERDGQIESFHEKFDGAYAIEYGNWFGLDDRTYFDLQTREPLTEDDYQKNVAGKSV
jgi:predicted  nucleic acid-binding Zn-ribbon protein